MTIAADIAKTIASQLGNRTFAMLGAKNIVAMEHGISFKIGKNPKGITHITITLLPSDTYRVHFQRVRGAKVTTVADLTDVYVSELQPTIEGHTGLYTRL